MTPTKSLFILLLIILVFATEGRIFGGVKQTQAVNSLPNTNNTNIGTNPYKDMYSDNENGYATVGIRTIPTKLWLTRERMEVLLSIRAKPLPQSITALPITLDPMSLWQADTTAITTAGLALLLPVR